MEMNNPEIQEARDGRGLFLYQFFKSIWTQSLDLIFPPRCQHCGRVDTVFCSICESDLAQVPVDIVEVTVPSIAGTISSGIHTGLLQSVVQALKYGGRRDLGEPVAKRLKICLERQNWQFDMIIPVPLHTNRLQKRGYNQAKEISIHLARLLDITHNDSWLIRQSQTQSQVGLSRDERLENVKNAFDVTTDDIQGITVLLVDDVRTTGATLATCADVLLEKGAQKVYAITASAAEHSNQ